MCVYLCLYMHTESQFLCFVQFWNFRGASTTAGDLASPGAAVRGTLSCSDAVGFNGKRPTYGMKLLDFMGCKQQYIYILLPVSPRKSGGLTPLRRDHFLRNSWPKSSHPGISSVLWNSRVHFWDVEHVPYTDFLGFLGCGFCGVCGAQTWVSSKHQTDIF